MFTFYMANVSSRKSTCENIVIIIYGGGEDESIEVGEGEGFLEDVGGAVVVAVQEQV